MRTNLIALLSNHTLVYENGIFPCVVAMDVENCRDKKKQPPTEAVSSLCFSSVFLLHSYFGDGGTRQEITVDLLPDASSAQTSMSP